MKVAYNPTKWWNAVGDGVTDDTAAIQKCLDAARAKRKDVHIPAGTYLVSGTLAIPSGLAVYGAGPDDDGTILLHQPASAGVDLLHLNEATDVHISGLCLTRVEDVRIVQHKDISRPWEIGLWLERGLQNEFYNVTIEDCAVACLYFHYQPGQGQTTTQLFQNCRFRQGWRGVIVEDSATITTRFIGCTVEDCAVAGVKTEGACNMTWIDPHVEGVPLAGGPHTIFELDSGSVVNVYGGWLGGYSDLSGTYPGAPTAPDPLSSIFRVNGAKSINLNGVLVCNAGRIFDTPSLPPDQPLLPPNQLVMVGVINENISGPDELQLASIPSLHIAGCML